MRIAIIAAAAIMMAGCVTTQELPMSPNTVRIDTTAGGLAFVGQAVPQTMRRAAEATLARGYTHFRLEQAATSQGSEVFGGRAHHLGGGAFTVTTMRRPTAQVGATVIMFHANEAGARGAFDARDILRQYRS